MSFKELIEYSGMKHCKLAQILGVKVDTLHSYSCGRLPVPAKRMAKMRRIVKKIEKL